MKDFHPDEAFSASPPPQETRSHQDLLIKSADGLSLHASVRGEGPSMLLCNGLFCSTHYYDYFLDHYSPRYRTVTFDYRSHGKSEDAPDPGRVTIEDLSADTLSVFTSCCQGPTVLVGHSMGVRTVLELYNREPSKISAIVLLCGSAWGALGPTMSLWPILKTVENSLILGGAVTPVATWVKGKVLRSNLVPQIGYLFGSMSKTLTPQKPVDGLMKNLERIDTRMMSSLARSYFKHDARSILSTLRVPTLFIVGARDALAPPSHARAAARLSKQIETYTVADCTHLALIERPEEVHREVDSFLIHRVLP